MSESNLPSERPPIEQTNFNIDIIKLVSGTALAQILLAFASLFLTRLYNPEAFGVFALFSAITGILGSVICLKYEMAIMLPKSDSDAANLLAGSLCIASFISILTIPVIWLGGPTLAYWLNVPQIIPYLWWLPIVSFFGGIGAGHQALNAWVGRVHSFNQISKSRVTGTVITAGTQLASGFSGFNSAGGLILGGIAGSIISPILLGWQIWRQYHSLFIQSIRWTVIWENLKRYQKFPTYNTFAALLNAISWQTPSFLLSFFFSATVVGYYALGNQLLRVPMDLIGASIGQAFFSHAATAKHEGKLAEFVESTFRLLVEYSFFPILILAMVGRELFVVIFGVAWAEAGVYTQILSVWMCFWFISSPLGRLYSVLERNEYSFRINIVVLVSRIVALWIGGLLRDPRIAIVLFSLSGVVVYGYLSISILTLAGVPWINSSKILLNNFALFAVAGGLLVFLKAIHSSDWTQVIASGVLTCIYFVYRMNNESIVKRLFHKTRDGKKL